jgi:hypothetical protein
MAWSFAEGPLVGSAGEWLWAARRGSAIHRLERRVGVVVGGEAIRG